MNKRHYEHTLPNIRGSLSNTYEYFLYLLKRLRTVKKESAQEQINIKS